MSLHHCLHIGTPRPFIRLSKGTYCFLWLGQVQLLGRIPEVGFAAPGVLPGLAPGGPGGPQPQAGGLHHWGTCGGLCPGKVGPHGGDQLLVCAQEAALETPCPCPYQGAFIFSCKGFWWIYVICQLGWPTIAIWRDSSPGYLWRCLSGGIWSAWWRSTTRACTRSGAQNALRLS
jgi:hypothetical protein